MVLIQRQLEKEVMDDPEQARIYAAADFSEPNGLFVQLVADQLGSLTGRRLVDLGCGPADIPIRLATAWPRLTITALDASLPMLQVAKRRLMEAGAGDRVELVAARLPYCSFSSNSCDAVISNSLLHHLPEPLWLWQEATRITRPGGKIVVMDLQRPRSKKQASAIVERYAGTDPPVLRRDFYNSLLAAFTIEEVKRQVQSLKLDLLVRAASDRHLSVTGQL